MFPPIPSWDGLHPLVIHFPIALLIVAPVLILIGAFLRARGRAFLASAFVLMVIGTVAACVAVSTGSSAAELAERAGGSAAVLEDHESLAETARNAFTALTVVFGLILIGSRLLGTRRRDGDVALVASPSLGGEMRRPYVLHRPGWPMMTVLLVFLIFYSGGLLLLVNTAHAGGRLVHEFGIRAMMPAGSQATKQIPTARPHDDDDD